MVEKMKKWIKGERGAVEIVEAALIYPIVIFVVIIFFFLGNVFYQQAKVDAIAVRAAEKLAVYYTNPLLRGSIPTTAENTTLDPYRYLFGSKGAETAVKSFVEKELSGSGTGAFSGMDINVQSTSCEIENYVVYHKACVQINYTIELLPLELIGADSLLRQSVGTAVSASDPAEFIRNVDMILDYADITGLTSKIQDTLGQFTGG